MNDLAKNVILWIVVAVVLWSVVSNFSGPRTGVTPVAYSDFMSWVREGSVREVVFEGDAIRGKRDNDQSFITYNPETSNEVLMGELEESNVRISATPPRQQNFFLQLFISSFPILLLIGVWVYFMRQMQGGGGGRGAMSFGKSRARLLGEDQVSITFADVAGVEEAKEEVVEIVDFLKDPAKFQRLGGKIPKGVLMVGSPGTGKTLLARAIAGEAKVPFFTISGSDFVEMFVGVGASRVRDMFEQAALQAIEYNLRSGICIVNDLTKNILVFIVIIVVLLSVVQGLSGVNGPPPEKTDYSQFLKQVKSGNVQRAEFDGKRITYGNRTPLGYYTISPETDNNTLIGILEKNNVAFTAQEPESQSRSCCSCSSPRSRSCC